MSPDEKLVRNERAKLTATWLNTMASASIVVGIVTPAAAAFYGLTGGVRPGWGIAVGAPIWILVGAGVHFLARRILGSLRS